MFKTFDQDRPYIERKYHDPEKSFNSHNRRAYHGYDYDPSTGMSDEEIEEGLKKLDLSGLSHPVAKARAIRFVLENIKLFPYIHKFLCLFLIYLLY